MTVRAPAQRSTIVLKEAGYSYSPVSWQQESKQAYKAAELESVQDLNESIVELDGVLTEMHEQSNQVTLHPVEDGTSVSDNVRPEPVNLIVRAISSTTPPDGDSDPYRDFEIWEQLVTLAKEGTELDVYTGMVAYKNMVISNVRTERSAATGQSVRPMITFRELVKADTVTITVPNLPQRGGGAGASRSVEETGKQEAEELSDSERESHLREFGRKGITLFGG